MTRIFSCLSIVIFALSLSAAVKQDQLHYSAVFGENRNFRVWMPSTYSATGIKRYAVIYYCHGCGGTYQGDQYTSYSRDGGYLPPYDCQRNATPPCDQSLNKPFNADFARYADSNDVLVVMMDGHINSLTGCAVYYPYHLNPSWTGNDYNFPLYFRELVHAVDSLYKTKAEPQYRALSGLSMGGYASLWIGAMNPHLVRSVSHFCFSPIYYSLGKPPYLTACNPTQFWRNFRGLSLRESANDQDYLYQYTQETGDVFTGAGFKNEYHLASFYRHWAADVDSQFNYLKKSFDSVRAAPKCFSFTCPYPGFDAWDYSVQSAKSVKGLIYLKDAARNGFGIGTRLWPPYGAPSPQFDMTIKTAPAYTANSAYHLVRYNYRANSFTAQDITADNQGRLVLVSSGGIGEEIGISGPGLQPSLCALADTLCDAIYLEQGRDSAISLDIVNLSENAISGAALTVTSENSCLTIVSGQRALASIPAKSRVHLDSAFILRGRNLSRKVPSGTTDSIPEYHNTGYVKVGFTLSGTLQDKEQIIQVRVMDSLPYVDSADVVVVDGGTASLPVNTSSWGGGSNYSSSLQVTGGIGDGDGVPDSGETVLVWIRLHQAYAPEDADQWHPVMPVNGMNNPDVALTDCKLHLLNRGREIQSGLIRINRTPDAAGPVDFPFMTELLYTAPSSGSYQDIESFQYRYGRLRFPLSPTIGTEKGGMPAPAMAYLRSVPNPFNPVTRLEFNVPAEERAAASLAIYAVSGKVVRTFDVLSRAASGAHGLRVEWKGEDDTGKALAGGIYLVKLTTPRRTLVKQVAYLP